MREYKLPNGGMDVFGIEGVNIPGVETVNIPGIGK